MNTSLLLVCRQGVQGCPQVKRNPQNFLGLEYDYEVLKQLVAENLSKTGIFHEFWLFLGGFWLLAILKQYDRILNLENRISWEVSCRRCPMSNVGAYL